MVVDGVLIRFSGMGYAAVATPVGGGVVNSWLLIGSVSKLVQTSYGQILVVKLALFAGMLALAIANRFWLVPALLTTQAGAEGDAVRRSQLWTHLLGVLLGVSILGTLRPAIGQ